MDKVKHDWFCTLTFGGKGGGVPQMFFSERTVVFLLIYESNLILISSKSQAEIQFMYQSRI